MCMDYSQLLVQAAEMPEVPGVYLFYPDEAQQALPVYVGKSVSIRTRVRSHIYQAQRDKHEARMLAQVKSMHYQPTIGEVGALLLETSLVKQYLPLFNKRLRRSRQVYFYNLHVVKDKLQPVLKSVKQEALELNAAQYGLFRSKRQAQAMLQNMIEEQQFCQQVLGMEKGLRSCFAWQLKRCRGACVGDESVAEHNARVQQAFRAYEHFVWPYVGCVAVIEKSEDSDVCAAHFVNQWRYLGTKEFSHIREVKVVADDIRLREFDIDHYKILTKALLAGEPGKIIELGTVCM